MSGHITFPRKKRYKLFALCLCIAGISFFAFIPCLKSDFVMWDDDISIYHNELITKLDTHHIKKMFQLNSNLVLKYTPLYWVSLAVTHSFFKLNPLGYHLGNLLFHSASIVVLFLLLYNLFSLVSSFDKNSIIAAAFFSSLFWGIHPLRVNAVVLAANRTYCQAIFFLILSLYLYLKSACQKEKTSGLSYGWRYWMSVILFGASLLTFPIGLTFAATYLFFDICHREKFQLKYMDIIKRNAPFALATIGVLIINVVLRENPQGVRAYHQFSSIDLFQMMKAFYMWAFYSWKPWMPFNLSPVNPVLIESAITDIKFFASAFAVIFLTLALIKYRKKIPGILPLWLLHLIILIPVLGITEKVHYPAERYSYLDGIIWSFIIGAGLCLLFNNTRRVDLRRIYKIFSTGVIAGLFVFTIFHTLIWKNSFSLFEHILSKLGDSSYRVDIYWRLGKAHFMEKNLDAAFFYYNRSLQLTPNYPKALLNRGLAYGHIKDFESAKKDFEKIIELSPGNINAHLFVAIAAFGLHDPGKAINNLKTVLELGRRTDQVFALLAQAHYLKGEKKQAKKACDEALRINPKNKKALMLKQKFLEKKPPLQEIKL